MHENKRFGYLREIETELKTNLGREAGAQGELFDEKTEGRKSSDIFPLMGGLAILQGIGILCLGPALFIPTFLVMSTQFLILS
jgi:hypothetical protein